MKLSIGVLVLCLAISATMASDALEESRDRFKAAREKCQSNPATAVSKDEFKRFRESKGKGPKPANYEASAICISKELRWLNEDSSTLSAEEVRRRVAVAFPNDAAKVDGVVSECAVDKGSPAANAEHLINCYLRHVAPPRPQQ